MSIRQSVDGDTKARLILAGERLFARDGIHGALVRDINELAGQRNSSALHYHFGSRSGLIEAILLEHQLVLDAEIARRLDELEARGAPPSVHDVAGAAVETVASALASTRGRYFLQIVPQMIHRLSGNLRRGEMWPVTNESGRVLSLLGAAMGELPEPVRRERLASFTIVLTTLLADRAKHLETLAEHSSAAQPDGALDGVLATAQYVDVLRDLIVGMLTAPSSVVDRHALP